MNRQLPYYSVLALVIGCIIGSGIFLKPSSMVAQLGSMYAILLIWLLAGSITLCGALCNAELACMFPETGGQYIFFKKIFGNFIAYLYGWSSVFVFNTAGIASIAYVAIYYFNYLYPLPRLSADIEKSYYFLLPGLGKLYVLEEIGKKSLTIFILIIFSWINAKSLAWGDTTQKVFSSLKYVAILGLVGLFFIKSDNDLAATNLQWHTNVSLGSWIAALTGAFWCFDGWNNIGFVAGEIKNPQKSIPKSLLHGIVLCLFVYLLFSCSLFYVLPADAISKSSFVAAEAGEKVGGILLGAMVVVLVIVSVAGSVNGNILACSRVSFAFFKDFPLVAKAGSLNRFDLPVNAIWFNTIWASLLVMTGSFDQLTDMLIFVSWIFYGLSAAGLIRARFSLAHLERPYKVPLYPIMPIIFILFSIIFLSFTIYTDFIQYSNGEISLVKSGFGLFILLIGVPYYLWYFRNKKD